MSRRKTENISFFALTAGGALLALGLRDRFGGEVHLPGCHTLGCGHCTSFDSLAEALPARFLAGDTVVCVTAAGIVFRLLAPHLSAKQDDPGVIVIDEEGRHIIPLLGGHAAGANKLAREIADFLGGQAAVTTASDVQGLTAPDEVAMLLNARVADPEAQRQVTGILVNGGNVCIESPADPGINDYGWVAPGGSTEGYDARLLITHLRNSGTPYQFSQVDSQNMYCVPDIPTARLVPRIVVAGIGCKRGATAAEIIEAVTATLDANGIDPLALASLASADLKSDEQGLRQAADELGTRLIFFSAAKLAATGRPGSDFVKRITGSPAVSEPAALMAAGAGSTLVAEKTVHGRVTVALAVSAQESSQMDSREAPRKSSPRPAGKVTVVGTGPGTKDMLTSEAAQAIRDADVVLGYRTYIEQLRNIFPGKDYRPGSMGKEMERCREALDLAAAGHDVVMVSSGDPGVYGMAGPLLELSDGIAVDIIPGITAAQTAASLLGAPLMNDYVTLSLSDLLTPRSEVLRRAGIAAASDLVVCLYNPASKKRRPLFDEVVSLLKEHRPPGTPVGWVRDAGGPGEESQVTTIEKLSQLPTDMRTIIIIGNSQTEVIGGQMVTRRGYRE